MFVPPINARRFVILVLLIITPQVTIAQKLPSVDKVVDKYLKAIGGKKAARAINDATYEWTIQLNEQPLGTARTQRKAPASERWEFTFGNGQVISATNARSAWEIGLDNKLRTLTAVEAATAKLRAALDAAHLVDFKKANILARVVSLGDLGSEPAYIVEFSMRSGARAQYYFSVKTGLITKITSDTKRTRIVFEDYRHVEDLNEPHRLRMTLDGSGELTLILQSVKHNTNIDDRVFDPPGATDKLDVAELWREVHRNQDEIDKRVSEYAFTQKETDKEISSKGELKKQTIKVYEVYPIPNREPVKKLISENGVPLSAERAAKEDKRVQQEFEEAERDREKDEKKAAERRAEREKKEKEGTEISPFLRVCDFVSPRREQWEGRETIVFDFRPKSNFRPKNREESLIAKLVGVVWIDPVDKQIIRLEARLAEGFKIAGGLVASLKPGAALVIEQTRMAQGIWLPRFAQINLSVKVLLFGGGDYNQTVEWSDYKHFAGDVKDYKVNLPATDKP
ncbi:MAG TPA: hypothetical protein VHQ94_01435 [Pyrinomonadaceae bacterium]|jgi:hypothetical protein|nr:hypothetical protein [Pyrinomonadaceae bacterium]